MEGLASSLTVAPVGRFGITVTILAGAGTVGTSLGPLFDAFFNLSISTMASCSLGVFPAQIFQVFFHFVHHLGLHRLELHFFKVRLAFDILLGLLPSGSQRTARLGFLVGL